MADKILIVDDEVHILGLLARCLKDHDFEVFQAASAAEGQKIVEEQHPGLLLLDVNMPGKSGIEFANELKKNKSFSKIPIIFLSAIEDKDTIASALVLGGVDYISKPFNIEDVIKKVYDALRQ